MNNDLKVLFTFKDGTDFGTEIDDSQATSILDKWVYGEQGEIEAGDYNVDGELIQEIKFFREFPNQ